ncbi:MAG: response regulator transcription factor [Kiritimatiellia bacterium]|jgi:DNA-binding response OmpR family regulator|nr:response regulator transcription factor [Kiritimatiellia bacterium]
MQGKRVLLVDDEQHIVDVVVYILEENAFEVIAALDGHTGLRLFNEKNPDLVILDLSLPGIPGLELFREMRKARPGIPVIMLTSRSEEIDRVLGLELGADDYVTKPFSTRELAARVKSVLRRSERSEPEQISPLLTHGPIEIDSDAFSARYFGDSVQLTRSEFKLVESLVRYPARVFTRDMLIDRIYDGEHIVTDRSIDAYIKRLRRKFAEIRQDINPIETVHGLGYKLNQDMEGAT